MKLFRKSCANESDVIEAMKKSGKYQLDTEQQFLASNNQYEYVRGQHGYDYMPPSRYLPSRTMSEDEDEDTSVDQPVRIQVAGSDLSESVLEDDDYGKEVYAMDHDPLKGKKMKGAKRQTTKEKGPPPRKEPHRQPRDQQRRYRDPASIEEEAYLRQRHSSSPVQPIAEERHYKNRRKQVTDKHVRRGREEREPVQSKAHRHEPTYREEEPPLLPQSPPESPVAPVDQRNYYKANTRDRKSGAYDHRSRGTEKSGTPKKGDADNRYRKSPDMKGIRELPTAFSYHSFDSAEDAWDEQSKHSRYEIGDEEDPYRRPKGGRPRNSSGWGESENSFNDYWRKKRTSALEEFTTPAYRREKKQGFSSVRVPIIYERGEGRENRTDRQEPRRRSASRDDRGPILDERAEEPPYEAEQRRRGNASDSRREDRRGIELSPEPIYDDESVEVEYIPREPRQLSTPREPRQLPIPREPRQLPIPREPRQLPIPREPRQLSNQELKAQKRNKVMKARKGKKKSKGIFGRIRGSVCGDKPGKRVISDRDRMKSTPGMDRPWEQDLRNKGSLFEQDSPSGRSEVSSHHRFDAPSARVPYPYEDDTDYDRPIRGRSSNPYPPPPEFDRPPKPRPRRDAVSYDRPVPPEYWYEQPVEVGRSRSNASGKPFKTAHEKAPPPLRNNADFRQRHIPMASSMSKHYQNQQKIGLAQRRAAAPPNRAAQVQPHQRMTLDGMQVYSSPKQKGFVGCH